MKATNLVVAGLLAATAVSPVLFAAGEPLSATQKKQVETVIHDYLIHNPEILIEVSQVLQKKQQDSMQKEAQSAILTNAEQVFMSGMTVAGNPKGSVTMVEFFDYQCIHCKEMKPVIDQLLQSDKNLRVVYKEFPIFGKTSELASRAALAAAMQGKYDVMHQALLKMDKGLTEAMVMDAAKKAGLDVDKMKKDMDSKETSDILSANRSLAQKLHLMGTPAFIIAATPGGKLKEGSTPIFVPGGSTVQALQGMIKKVSS